MKYAVQAQNLSKKYKCYPTPKHRILEALPFTTKIRHREHWALRDVTFKLETGKALGIIGANGAGKSTMMKILAGTTSQTYGTYRIVGKVSSLLELGAGFHKNFTGRENLIMNGIMMGFTRKEMERKFPEIHEYSELGSYIYEPVRTYSSGMGMRLGFSTAVAVDPDVLIIDEVFAVGDMHFQKKCVDTIHSFRERGKTIIFCSHSLYDVRQLCDNALWIRDGKLEAAGDATMVTNEYAAYQRSRSFDPDEIIEKGTPLASGNTERFPSIESVEVFHPGTEEEAYKIEPGASIDVRVRYKNPDPVKMPVHLGVGFLRSDQTLVTASSTQFDGLQVPGESGQVTLHVPNLKLLSGSFVVFAVLFDEIGVHRYDHSMAPRDLVVLARGKELGLYLQEHSWSVQPGNGKA